MPYDAQVSRALELLRGGIDEFRAAARGAHVQVADYLATHRAPAAGVTAQAAATLGRFASGRLDVAHFAATFGGGPTLGRPALERIERCAAVLAEVAVLGDDAFVCELPTGVDLESELADALANLGRAFGAVAAFHAARTGAYREEMHGALLGAFPFERWNRLERQLAPPLVFSVDGADLDAPRLARFVDGRIKIVLIVRGEIAPGALVPLITPGVLVLQSGDVNDLALLQRCGSPAIAGIVPGPAARFTHRPCAGSRLADRLVVHAMPRDVPRRAVGPWSAAQQVEQVAQLALLVRLAALEVQQATTEAVEGTLAAANAVANAAAGGGAAVEHLAVWLLARAGHEGGSAS